MTCGNTGCCVTVEQRREEGRAAPWIVPDELWERIEPLLPVVPAGQIILGGSGWIAGRSCPGSCSSYTRGFRGSSCPRSWASARA